LAQLKELKELKEQYEKNLAALDKYKRNDPDRLKQLGTKKFFLTKIVIRVNRKGVCSIKESS